MSENKTLFRKESIDRIQSPKKMLLPTPLLQVYLKMINQFYLGGEKRPWMK